MVWAARIALLTLVMQLTAFGHWNVGPFHADNSADSLATHAAHCHTDISGCAGDTSVVGTYLEKPLETLMPYATLALPVPAEANPPGFVPAAPEQPPRGG